MRAADGCRPVRGNHHLNLGRTTSSGAFIPGPQVSPASASAISLPPFTGAPEPVIRQHVRRLHQEILPDWSGSTFSVWGGDPADKIGAAGESVLALQRRYGGGSASIGPWGTTPPAHLAVGPLQVRHNFRTLKKALRNRENLGGNNCPDALHAAADRIGRLAADVAPVVWVPTDGCESVTAATHAAVDALPPGSVHLVIIDPLNWCTAQMEADWRTVSFGSVTRIKDLSVKNLATTIAQICADTLGLQLGNQPATSSS